jgi:prevent-host-death family protein
MARSDTPIERIIDAAEMGEEFYITMRGRPVAVVVGIDQYEALTAQLAALSEPERPTADQQVAVLKAGLTWLYETEQPDGAIDQHHGVTSPEVGGRRYRFIPQGDPGIPGPIVVVDVAHPRMLRSPYRAANPLGGREEVDEVIAALARLGREVVDSWNGNEGNITASLALADAAHDSLLAVVRRYGEGCPDHDGSVFCHGEGCTWFADGHKLLVRPTWPAEGER